MLIYSQSKAQFDRDVLSGKIADQIDQRFWECGLRHENEYEYTSWRNSLKYMQGVLDSDLFSDELQIAIEYQIPQTSKRVDFIIAGASSSGEANLVIIELKQWSYAQRTSRHHIVKAHTGGCTQDVTHPSYQAYSYAKTIEGTNYTLREKCIGLHPCAYLHNYDIAKKMSL